MAFIILTSEGEPLADLDGQLIRAPTKEKDEYVRLLRGHADAVEGLAG